MERKPISTSEVVAVVFYYASTNAHRYFFPADLDLHQAFFEIRKSSFFLKPIRFAKMDSKPYSEELDRTIERLIQLKLLRVDSRGDRYIADQNFRRETETKILPKFTTEERRTLSDAACVFARNLPTRT